MACLSPTIPALLLPITPVVNSKTYIRRTPEKSILYKIVYHHFQENEKIYPEKYEQDFGSLRKILFIFFRLDGLILIEIEIDNFIEGRI